VPIIHPTVSGVNYFFAFSSHPRQLALMHALVSFSYVLAGHFTTSGIYPRVLQTLGFTADQYKLNSLRYDLSKLRAKTLVEKIPDPAATASPRKDTASASST
jgi:hypothetical protein